MTLRVLFASDAPWSVSGYGVITRQQAPALAELGHDVALLATFGLHGATQEWHPPHWPAGKNMRVYPGGIDAFANDAIGPAARDWKADIVITLKDIHVFRPEAFQGLRWIPLVPVDHEPIPPQVANLARAAYRPIAYAPNGFRELRRIGLDPLYVPHSYDPSITYPMDKGEARKKLGIPDDLFIVGMVAVNRGGIPSRKAWPQNLEGAAIFLKQHPDAFLFLHTYLCTDGREGGVNIPALVAQLSETYRFDMARQVGHCDQQRYIDGFPDSDMTLLYNAIDVLNAVSLGEGFGIPQLEAQACGAPVITSSFAAARDLCFSGWPIPDRRGHRHRFYDGQGAYVFLPEPESIAERMEEAYQALRKQEIMSVPPEVTEAELAQLHAEIKAFYGGEARHALRAGDVQWTPAPPSLREQAIAGAAPFRLDNVIQSYWKPALEAIERQIAREGERGVLRIIRPEEVLV